MADDAGRIEALYDTDVIAWAEQQAAALRRRATGDELDYDNLAEEIEGVGKSERRSCLSYIDVIIEHLLKLEFASWLRQDNQRGWRASVKVARAELRGDLTPTLRVRLPAELPDRCALQAELLLGRNLIPESAPVLARQADGYTWEQVTGDWWPEPR